MRIERHAQLFVTYRHQINYIICGHCDMFRFKIN
jgi:hypothetical protein